MNEISLPPRQYVVFLGLTLSSQNSRVQQAYSIGDGFQLFIMDFKVQNTVDHVFVAGFREPRSPQSHLGSQGTQNEQ